MSIPNNITREHLEKAIEKIDKEGIPPNGDSQYYDVEYNGKLYPPKLMVSLANYFANGEILDRRTFTGGINTPCFNLLEDKNFVIHEKKEKNLRKVWIEKTITQGRNDRLEGERALGKALWSPKQSKNGADIYKNMRSVNSGDLIIHLVNNEIFKGISLAEKSAQNAPGIPGTPWNTESYLIPLEQYEELNPPLHRAEVLTEKNKKLLFNLSGLSEVFYTKNLNLRQGAYLTPCTPEFLEYINTIYKEKSDKNLPHIDKFKDLEHSKLNEAKEELSNVKTIAIKKKVPLNTAIFLEDAKTGGLQFSKKLIDRFVSSLCTKPFVILTGLSGSGKTKLAQSFAQWICEDDNQYCIVPVGADWTNKEPLLGYPNALDDKDYVNPENGILNLIKGAISNTDLPYFLILDEMNLSHVERYFAEFLSAMESDEEISLHNGLEGKNGVPPKIKLPTNLFLIGTVNIDETTYMFSPKVLDRANTIEFRVSAEELLKFFNDFSPLDISMFKGQGANMAQNFLEISRTKYARFDENLKPTLLKFFKELKKTGAEFGYRTAVEISTLFYQLQRINESLSVDEKLDIAIMQKLLPKLHGSRRKLCPVLITLGSFCIKEELNIETDVFENSDFDFSSKIVKYPLSLEKIKRLYKGAIDHGFASYAEA